MTPLIAAALSMFVLLGVVAQTMTGFGLNVIAVTLGALLIPIKLWLPVMVGVNIPVTAWIAWQGRAHVNWSLLLRRVLPLMLLGGAVGFGLAMWLSGNGLKRGFGVLVIGIALAELRRLVGHRPARGGAFVPWTLLAGLVQGMYASGGPFLVHAFNRIALDRHAFRATLLVLWLMLNSALLIAYLMSGWFTLQSAKGVALLLPFVPVGIALGNWLHRRAPERTFAIVVQLVLLCAGTALVVS